VMGVTRGGVGFGLALPYETRNVQSGRVRIVVVYHLHVTPRWARGM
jgi:hypothetical protein